MGLDLAEIVMAVEEEFDITLIDENFQDIKTIGEFHDYIVALLDAKLSKDRVEGLNSEVRNNSTAQYPKELVWPKLQKIIARIVSVKTDKITKDASFQDLDI